MNSHEFLCFLQDLTGIHEVLIPDPHFVGGGLHEIKRGGLLKIHWIFVKIEKLVSTVGLMFYST